MYSAWRHNASRSGPDQTRPPGTHTLSIGKLRIHYAPMSTPSTARLQMPTVCDFDPLFVDDTARVAAGVVRVIRAATPGGFVIATDLPDICLLLQHNLDYTPRPISQVPPVIPKR
ncbi:hypothetical protein L210DRAFT_3554027 [Boletus edulis BED1]|uniref:Uncharacterized protein n=1 Tax=Boletus edulis BED1 TaxID=1328754 RepID=A0AAD4BMB1_BOLED|nr:hypothetical protein L210DRAFT_3554027 [Boletus edulis BED1]